MFEASQLSDESPAVVQRGKPRRPDGTFCSVSVVDSGAPKRGDRRLRLTRVDKRSVAGQRIAELKALFKASLGDRPLTPMLAMRIAEASELKALAEKARGDYLRGGGGNLDDTIRAERRADQAVRALGIGEAKPKALSFLAQLAVSAPR